MQKKRLNKRIIKQRKTCMIALLLAVVFALGTGMFYVNSRYVFRYGVDGIQLDRYEPGTDPIDPREDPDQAENVPEGSFRVHINHLPIYDSAKGYNLQIWNPSNNQYLMRVTILQKQNTLYASDLIRTGRKIEDLKLTGEQADTATAVFTAYDKKTLEKIGSTEVQITLPTVTP